MKKKKRIIFGCGMILLIGIGFASLQILKKKESFLDTKQSLKNKNEEQETIKRPKADESIEEKENFIDRIPENKKIYLNSMAMFYKEPTVENLYDMADIVILASFKKDLDTFVVDEKIKTNSNFEVLKIVKNTTKRNLDNVLTLTRPGGVVKLASYLEDASASTKERLKDFNSNEYYVVEQTSELNLQPKKQFLIFLADRKEELRIYAKHYGIVEVKENQVYDYEKKEFRESPIDIK